MERGGGGAARDLAQQMLAMRAYRLLTTVFMVILIAVAVLTAVSLAVGINGLTDIYGNVLVIIYVLLPYALFLLIQLSAYDTITYSAANRTAIALNARSMANRARQFDKYIYNLEHGNATLRLPARFTDPAFAATFDYLYSQMDAIQAAASNISSEVTANNATHANEAIQAAVDVILSQKGTGTLVTPLVRRTTSITVDSFHTATVQQYAFAFVILVVLLATAVIVLWPLRSHLK